MRSVEKLQADRPAGHYAHAPLVFPRVCRVAVLAGSVKAAATPRIHNFSLSNSVNNSTTATKLQHRQIPENGYPYAIDVQWFFQNLMMDSWKYYYCLIAKYSMDYLLFLHDLSNKRDQ